MNIKTLDGYSQKNWKQPVSFVYTAMHGVATPFLLDAFETFAFPHPKLVAEQCKPDPEFPTVKFPNPEEKGGSSLLPFSTLQGKNADDG